MPECLSLSLSFINGGKSVNGSASVSASVTLAARDLSLSLSLSLLKTVQPPRAADSDAASQPVISMPVLHRVEFCWGAVRGGCRGWGCHEDTSA